MACYALCNVHYAAPYSDCLGHQDFKSFLNHLKGKGKDIVADQINFCASSARPSSETKVTSVKSREAGGKEALTIESSWAFLSVAEPFDSFYQM